MILVIIVLHVFLQPWLLRLYCILLIILFHYVFFKALDIRCSRETYDGDVQALKELNKTITQMMNELDPVKYLEVYNLRSLCKTHSIIAHGPDALEKLGNLRVTDTSWYVHGV